MIGLYQQYYQALRLVVSFTLAAACALWWHGPFAFICPLLTLHIVVLGLPEQSLQAYVRLWLSGMLSIGLGVGVAKLHFWSPLVFLVAIAAILFAFHRYERIKPNPLHSPLRILCLVLVAAIAMFDGSQVSAFALSAGMSLSMAMVLAWFSYCCLPSAGTPDTSFEKAPAHVTPASPILAREWLALIVIMPVFILFAYTDYSRYIVLLMTVCVLMLSPELKGLPAIGKRFIVGNLVGGSIAIMGYWAYRVLSPGVSQPKLLALLIVCLCCCALALLIYRAKQSTWRPFSLTPFALLLSLGNSDTLYGVYEVRMVCIAIAVIYVYLLLSACVLCQRL